MGKGNFRKNQCIRALIRLGFTRDTTRRNKHEKFIAPQSIPLKEGKRPFIMVPRGDLKCQLEILKELRVMGGEKLEQTFIENL